MIDFDVIDELIYDWVSTFSGITTIWADDNSPKPDLPYISLRKGTVTPIGHGYISVPTSSGISKISGDRDMIVNFQAYGNNAFGKLENLWHVRLDPGSQELLYIGGLSLIELFALTNLTGLNDTLFEGRAQMDLLFRFVSQRTNIDVGLIETVEIEGNLKEPDDTFNFNVDLT